MGDYNSVAFPSARLQVKLVETFLFLVEVTGYKELVVEFTNLDVVQTLDVTVWASTNPKTKGAVFPQERLRNIPPGEIRRVTLDVTGLSWIRFLGTASGAELSAQCSAKFLGPPSENSPPQAQQSPTAADGRPFVVPNIFPGEVHLAFAGRPDEGGNRYAGAPFLFTVPPVGNAQVDFSFQDGIFLAGGHFSWVGGGSPGSYADVELRAKASTVENAVANDGDCNLVATGIPGLNSIVPASGNGAKRLLVPVPVPAVTDETNEQNGLWDCEDLWIGAGEVLPTVLGKGKYNLFDQPLLLARLATLPLLPASGSRELLLSNVNPKWVLPQWTFRVLASNTGSTALSLTWNAMIARRRSS